MLKSKPVSAVAEYEKIPFEVTPFLSISHAKEITHDRSSWSRISQVRFRYKSIVDLKGSPRWRPDVLRITGF